MWGAKALTGKKKWVARISGDVSTVNGCPYLAGFLPKKDDDLFQSSCYPLFLIFMALYVVF